LVIERHGEQRRRARGAVGWNIPHLEVALLQQVYERWLRLCQGAELPLVSALDALDFLPFSSNIILAEVLPDGDVEFRIVGEEIIAARGANLKGARLSQFEARLGDNPSLSQFKDAVEQCRPQYYDGPAYNFEKTYLRARRLILPFLNDEGSCQKLLVAIDYNRAHLS
tara:strand:+ start:790 stop:1293 length:504 start_codon:yes stop_codon:yes gene_type:complete